MPEYMDIVNEDDEVVGQDTRERIHADYKVHRGVHVLICNSDKEVLIQKRSSRKDYYPGYYDISVGAQVSSGESYEDGARRELAEEIGCLDAALVPIAYYDSFSPRQREKRKLYLFICDGPFKIDPGEVDEIEFVPLGDVSRLMKEKPFTEGCKKSVHLYLHYLSTGHRGMLNPRTSKSVLEAAGLEERDSREAPGLGHGEASGR